MSLAPAPIEFLPLGAIIQSFCVGNINLVQNFPKQSQYQSHNAPYFGETIGRVANRIKLGKIDSLNGKSYQLKQNNGNNALHGGPVGWGKRIWDGPKVLETRTIPNLPSGKFEGGETVAFKLTSEDGDEGYPGTVEATVTYTAGKQILDDGQEATVLAIEYEAELVGDADETIVNLTNHSYFNLTGEASISGTDVVLSTDQYLPLDDSIPKGGPEGYPNISADKLFTLGPEEPAIDDCFVFPSQVKCPIDTRKEQLQRLVWAHHKKTNITLEVYSTEPAFQFYTGAHIDVPAVDGLPARGPRSGFCVEPTRFVNAVNRPEWRDQVLLKKGTKYGSRVVYRAWNGGASSSA